MLYCHCARAELISREARAAALEVLSERGEPFLALPDLCASAAARSPLLRAAGARAIACYPRAVRWFLERGGASPPPGFAAVGLREREPGSVAAELCAWLEPSVSGAPDASAEPEGLEILARLRLRSSGAAARDAGALAARLLDRGFAVAAGARSEAGAVEIAVGLEVRSREGSAGPDWVPWYPVIDYDRCANCGQCLDFCLFGVYDRSADGRVEVRRPENCKTYCPACARVCPELAIIFPRYEAGPIAGGEVREGDREALRVDLGSLAARDVYAALKARAGGKRFSLELPIAEAGGGRGGGGA